MEVANYVKRMNDGIGDLQVLPTSLCLRKEIKAIIIEGICESEKLIILFPSLIMIEHYNPHSFFNSP